MCSPRLDAEPADLTQCHRGILDIEDPLPAYLFQPTLTVEPLGGGLWTVSDGTYRSVFCEGAKGLIAFDTFYSPGAAISYRKALNRVFPGKPIHTIVYSHDHLDHTGFSAQLAPGAEIIAHQDCAEVVEARGADGQRVPTETFSGAEAEYVIDGIRLRLHNPGATHGNGNLAASFPEQSVLFMVDTVAPGVGYTFFPDWHLAGYTETMRSLFAKLDRWERFIPGHFWPMDRAAAEANLRYCDTLREYARQALSEGLDSSDLSECHAWAVRHLGPQYGREFRFNEYAGMNLMRMMLHVEQGGWGQEDARPDPPLTGSERVHGQAEVGEVDATEIRPGVTVAEADGVSALLVAAPQGEVCIGTLGSAAAANALRQLSETAPLTVLATDHLDQSGFAHELGASEVVLHEQTARALEGKLRVPLPKPERRIEGCGGSCELLGLPTELLYPGPTCGTGTLAVYLPESSVLYVVGPRPDARYGLIADVHLAGATRRWRRLAELEAEVVVFARGGVGTLADLRRACDYLDDLAYVAQKAFADGVAIWDIRAMEEYATELLRGPYGDLDGFSEQVGIGAIRVVHHYLMGGWGLEDRLSRASASQTAGCWGPA